MKSVGRHVPRHAHGLTLIELMVVVAVLAILATIVVPTYDNYVRNARRAEGRSAAMSVALAEERYFSIYQTYTTSLSELISKAGLQEGVHLKDGSYYSPKEYYTITINNQPCTNIAQCFTVVASPVKTDAECTQLTLQSDGKKGGSGSNTYKCWLQ
jgi:type IV pilus assembly protein PilE